VHGVDLGGGCPGERGPFRGPVARAGIGEPAAGPNPAPASQRTLPRRVFPPQTHFARRRRRPTFANMSRSSRWLMRLTMRAAALESAVPKWRRASLHCAADSTWRSRWCWPLGASSPSPARAVCGAGGMGGACAASGCARACGATSRTGPGLHTWFHRRTIRKSGRHLTPAPRCTLLKSTRRWGLQAPQRRPLAASRVF
jgi:hypothetical protein